MVWIGGTGGVIGADWDCRAVPCPWAAALLAAFDPFRLPMLHFTPTKFKAMNQTVALVLQSLTHP